MAKVISNEALASVTLELSMLLHEIGRASCRERV